MPMVFLLLKKKKNYFQLTYRNIWGGERRGSSSGIRQLQKAYKAMYGWGGLGLKRDQMVVA